MFDIDRSVADCRAALAERSSEATSRKRRPSRAVAEPDGILKVLSQLSGASAAAWCSRPRT